MRAELILENGKRFQGEMFGCQKDVVGEVIFTTEMIGYKEIIINPSYAGQIVVMTFPMIGNYGINLDGIKGEMAKMSALIVREKCDTPSNFRNEMTLDAFLKAQGVCGLYGIDTRALTRILRNEGTMKGVIVKCDTSEEDVKSLMQSLDNSNVIMENTTKSVYIENPEGDKHVALVDMGDKGVISQLTEKNCKVTVFPADTASSEILEAKPDAVLISNGPGSPLEAGKTVNTVKELFGKVPVCGVSMGHQIIGMALGAKVEKLKFGHHGASQPVKELATGKAYVTSQNHDYIIKDLPQDVEITFVNINDESCEGLVHKTLPVKSVQFHPQAAPGALDMGFLLDSFLKEVK